MIEPIKVRLPGATFRLGIANDEFIYTLSFKDQNHRNLVCINFKGEIVWNVNLTSIPGQLRLASNGTVWIGATNKLHQYGSDGNRLKTINVPCRESEHLENFLLTADGFLCSFQDSSVREPRVVKLTVDGKLLWSATIFPNQVAFDGVQEMGVHTEWKRQPMKPWDPVIWVADLSEPLLLTNNYILASFGEHPHSGIGRSYCLDYISGDILWVTESRPAGTKAITNDEHFLIGAQGYGAFDTYLYDKEGTILNHWPSHGDYLLTEDGEIRLVEMENSLPSKMHFSILHTNGRVQKGPHLSGYHTTYPVIDKDCTAAFWRDGKLILIDKHLKKRILYSDNSLPERPLLTRMLLTKQGMLAFVVNKELWLL
ncbi:MAG: hypothetical protein AAF485_10995, partial [Chloroflexota bacterium]